MSNTIEYSEFLLAKSQLGDAHGFTPVWMPEFLFDFQENMSIDRCLTLFSNEGETVLTPFMDVGSEVYAAVRQGRCGIGIELKLGYYRQAVRNLELVRPESSQDSLTFSDG